MDRARPGTKPRPGGGPAAGGRVAWSHVTLGLIPDLPPSISPDGQRCCAVVTLVDRLSRQARFLAAPDAPSACQVASLILTNVQGRLGPPESLLWDRDPLQPGAPQPTDSDQQFWSELCERLHVPATPLPPASAGTSASGTPALRRVLEQLIRAHTHHLHDAWAPFLPIAEAAFNGTRPATLSAAPFLARAGGLAPRSAPASPRGSYEAPSPSPSPSPSSSSFSAPSSSAVALHHLLVRDIHLRAQLELQAARARYGDKNNNSRSSSSSSSRPGSSGSSNSPRPDNQALLGGPGPGQGHRSQGTNGLSISTSISGSPTDGDADDGGVHCVTRCDPQFRVGDSVRLSTTHLCLPDKPEARLRPGFLGPFTVVGVVSPAAYRLDLPASLGRLHPVFHVSRLLAWSDPDAPRTPAATPPPTLLAASSPASPIVTQSGCSPVAARSLNRGVREPESAAAMTETEAAEDVVLGVRLSQVGRMQPTVMFHIRWGRPRLDGQDEGWEPYSAVEGLPAVRAYLRGREWREWRKTEAVQQFIARWPERFPRLVRFEI